MIRYTIFWCVAAGLIGYGISILASLNVYGTVSVALGIGVILAGLTLIIDRDIDPKSLAADVPNPPRQPQPPAASR